MTLNGLLAAGGVIVPMFSEYYALAGISDLIATVRKIRQAVNPDLDITGIVRTMHDSRSRLVAEVSEQLRSHFRDLLVETVIPRNIRLAETPSHGIPEITYDAQAEGYQGVPRLSGRADGEGVRQIGQSKSGCPCLYAVWPGALIWRIKIKKTYKHNN